MPFTFAHPAAAVPLTRVLGHHGSLAALVIGSMVPDLPFFLGVLIPRTQTHSLPGLIMWALPAGLVLYALFHFLLKDALIALAPSAVRGRLAVHPQTTQPSLSAIILSLLAGAATHIVWDGFTHPETIVVRNLPFLQTSWGRIGGYELYVYKFLQHLSSLAGLSLLALWCWRWFSRAASCAPAPGSISSSARKGICAVLLIAPLVAGGSAAYLSEKPAARVPDFVFTALPTFFWMLTVFALGWWMAKRRLSSNPTQN